MPKKFIVGIDEVGRGPLAGPVVVAAVAFPVEFRPRSGSLPLRDSKKLTKLQKQAWFEYVRQQPKIYFSTARVYSRGIDRLNISRAANRAASHAFTKLITKYQLPISRLRVYLDGGLFLEKMPAVKAKTVVRGDEKIKAIKLASIVAKVTRDKYMVKLHKKHPAYGFYSHKGYGTKKHKKAISRHGLTDFHRKTFCKFV